MITLKLNELSRRLYLCINMYMWSVRAHIHTHRDHELEKWGNTRVRGGEGRVKMM